MNDQPEIERALELKAQGHSETYIAMQVGISTPILRRLLVEDASQKHIAQIETANQMKAAQHSNAEIAEQLGINESTVRQVLDPAYRQDAQGMRDFLADDR